MLVLKRKEFSSFGDRLKGNPKFREDLINLDRVKPIQDYAGLNIPLDIKKLLTVLNKHSNGKRENYRSSKGVINVVLSENEILKQFNDGSVFGVQKHPDRIVLTQTTGNSGFTISYDVNKKQYVCAEESVSYAILSRAVNRIFGNKGPQIHFSSPKLNEVIKWIDNNVITYYY